MPTTATETTFPACPEDLLTSDLVELVAGREGIGEILDQYTVRDLADQSPQELRERGLTRDEALRVSAAFELGRRLGQYELKPGVQLKNAQQIFDAFRYRLQGVMVERFFAVLLDARSRVIKEELISQGILTASLVHPREVFAPAIRHRAASILLLHNHPSLDPEPSPEDIEITRRLCAVGELVGIRVSDHVVIGGGRYVSFLERGLIFV